MVKAKKEPVELPPIDKSEILMDTDKIFMHLDACVEASLDTETTGLSTQDDHIIGVSLGGHDWECYVPFTGEYAQSSILFFRRLAPYLADPERTFIMHNVSFDYKMLMKRQEIEEINCHLEDTKILSWGLDENTSNGLKDCVERDLKIKMTQYGDIRHDENSLHFCKYGQDDARYTYDLYVHYMGKYAEFPMILRAVQEIEYPALKEIMHMELEGVMVDVAKLRADREFYSTCIDKYEQAIYKIVGHEFNINSPIQLRKVMFDELKFDKKGLSKTDGGKYGDKPKEIQTNKLNLIRLSDRYTLPKVLLYYRKMKTVLGTFVNPIIERAEQNSEHRIFCSFNTVRAVTGRMACSNPNLQNQPSTKRMRSCYIAKEGYKFVGADFSQIEIRLMAHFSQDPYLQKIYNSGELYITNYGKDKARIVGIINGITGFKLKVDAEELSRVPTVKDPVKIPFLIPLEEVMEKVDMLIDAGADVYFKSGDVHQATADKAGCKRGEAKAINFGFLYGMYPKRFVMQQLENGNKVTLEEATKYRKAYFATYKGVASYQKQVEAEVARAKFVTTVVGRRRRLNKALRDDFNKGCRQGLNSRIQGTGADLMKLAIRNVGRALRAKAEIDPRWKLVKMLLVVHDEILTECPEDMAEEVLELIVDKMESGVTLSVPIEADGKIGNNWADVH